MSRSIAHYKAPITPDALVESNAALVAVLPAQGFVREPTVLVFIPVGRSTLWEMIRRGEFARPVKLSTRVSAWRVEDVRSYIAARQ